MRQNPPKLGAAHAFALEAYLKGTLPAPDSIDSPFRTLALLVQARCKHGRPGHRRLAAFYDDAALALTWRAAWDLVEDVSGDQWQDSHRANTARHQVNAVFERCVRKIAELDFVLDYNPSGDGELASQRTDYELLAGGCALPLAEICVKAGREHLRTVALREVEHEDGGHLYAAAFLGLSMSEHYAWLPGQPATGSLARALSAGQDVIEDLGVPAGASLPDQPSSSLPEKVPGWFTETHIEATRKKAQAAARTAGPSLEVVHTVEHLPGTAEDGKSKPGRATAHQARGEWAPFAGRAWPLTPVPDLATARAVLVAEFPYAEALIDAILRDLVGRPHVVIRALLLVGGPGSGKTRFARRLAEVLGLGWQVYGCAGVADASFTGTSRQWSTGRASVPLQMLKRLSAASGLVVLDEIDKVATSQHNGALIDAMLPLLTQDSARFHDPYLETATDLSAVSYVATANDLSTLRRSHAALVDRFRVYGMPSPRIEDLPTVLRTILADIRAERGLDEAWCPDLDGGELDLVAEHFRKGGSLRLVRRLAEAVVAGRDVLATRN